MARFLKSFSSRMVIDDVLAPTLFNLFFDNVISMSLQKHPENGLSILFNTEAELVGTRKDEGWSLDIRP